MTNEQALKGWTTMLALLKQVPEDMRSPAWRIYYHEVIAHISATKFKIENYANKSNRKG